MQLKQFTDLGLRAVMRLAVARERETPNTAAQVAVSYMRISNVVTRLRDLGVVDAHPGERWRAGDHAADLTKTVLLPLH